MPPEYINDRAVSKKFDVFSLGVIIIKIMAGNRGRREMPPDQFIKFVRGTSLYRGQMSIFFMFWVMH